TAGPLRRTRILRLLGLPSESLTISLPQGRSCVSHASPMPSPSLSACRTFDTVGQLSNGSGISSSSVSFTVTVFSPISQIAPVEQSAVLRQTPWSRWQVPPLQNSPGAQSLLSVHAKPKSST